jgi:hypothetical protein
MAEIVERTDARVTVLPDIVLMTLEPTRHFCHSCGRAPIYTDVYLE